MIVATRIMKNLLIKKSNELVLSSYNLNLVEARFLAVCLGKTYYKNLIAEAEEFKVDVEEFGKIFELSNDTAYRQLKALAESLTTRKVIFRSFYDESLTVVSGWLAYIKYNNESQTLVISFNKELLPHLSELTEKFTIYKLEQIKKMVSSYSVRVYELCKCHAHPAAGFKFISTVEELKQFLGVEDKYNMYAHFKDKIIKPSIREINELTDLEVEFFEHKQGKKIVKLSFIISLKVK